MDKANILPLYAAPQYAEQVTDWIWHAFGEGLPRAFFHSIVEHSQTPGALPLTFIAVQNEQLLGTVGPPFKFISFEQKRWHSIKTH